MKGSRLVVAVGASLMAVNAAAQSTLDAPAADRCDLVNLSAPPPWSVQAQQSVVDIVKQANACLGQRDAACAANALAPAQEMRLSDDERAFLAIPTAELATLRDDRAAAVATYRASLALPAIGEPLQREIAWRLAFVLNTRGEFAEALRVLDPRQCRGWTGEALALRAVAYESLGARTPALENYVAAATFYGLQGKQMPAAFADRHQALVKADPPRAVEGTDVAMLASVSPTYPERALRSGTSGWVQLEFGITDVGTVEDIKVEASTNEVFEPPSIAAVQRWRYVPKFENGLPVARDSHQTVLKFCIDPCRWRSSPPPERGADGRYPVTPDGSEAQR